MNIPNTLTMPQLILITSLFTLLISWLVISAYLALRPTSEKHAEWTEHTAPLPIVKSPALQTFSITTPIGQAHRRQAPGTRTIAQQTPAPTVSATDSTREIVFDHS